MRSLNRKRLVLAIMGPVVVLGLLEGGLRLAGSGYPTAFLLREGDHYVSNERFGWRFFPRSLARVPCKLRIAAAKPPGTCRIVILGESAAMGTPDPAFGFGRWLEAMLRVQFPEQRFEVINAAMTAINSHALVGIAQDCARLQPDYVVVYMGNNEVVGPFGPGTVFSRFTPSRAMIRASLWARSTRTGQLLENALRPRREPAPWRGMEMFLEHQVAADDPRLARVYENFRANLRAICAVSRAAGAQVIVATVATNLQDPPFASAAAEVAYRRGQLLQARDLDALRFRADSRINAIIREEAGGSLADVESAFDDTGLFYDHVHPVPRGNYLLASVVFRQIAGRPTPPAYPTCAEWLALTDWDEYRLAAEMAELTAKPPFTNQIDHPQRQAQRLSHVTRLRSAARAGGEAVYETALRRSPEDWLLHGNYARLLYERGQYPGAVEHWQQVLALFPRDAETEVNLANALLRLGRLDDARAQYQSAIKLRPQFAEAHKGLGDVLLLQKQYPPAIAALTEALRLKPDYPAAANDLGAAKLARNDLDGAAAAFSQAVALQPDAASHGNLAIVLAKQGRYAEAAAAAGRAADCAATAGDDPSARQLRERAARYLTQQSSRPP